MEAAQDLGCPPWNAFWLVTVPLSLPGVLAGSFLVFIPALGEFVIPDLLGGSETLMIGRTLWSEFFANRDWPLASAVAIVLLVVILGPILLYRQSEARRAGGARDEPPAVRASTSCRWRWASPSSTCRSSCWWCISFNESQAGDGLGRLLDPLVRRAVPQSGAARRGLGHGRGSASSRRRSRPFSARSPRRARALRALPRADAVHRMVYAPLVMPEVITGLSLLLLFVSLDIDRGFWTVTHRARHLTMCFVTVVVQSRLLTFDRTLEEAALDLGATPLRDLLPGDAAADRAGGRGRLDARLHAVAGRSGDRELHVRARARRPCRCGSTARSASA